jgi:hypothetical protein
MGLIGISTPQLIGDSMFVVVATTEQQRIKLFYNDTDSTAQLIELLSSNGVDESVVFHIVKAVKTFSNVETNGDEPASLARKLPGVDKIAKHPVTKAQQKLWTIVISLNDTYQWKREDIADWIESAFDTKDIAFDPPAEVKNEKRSISEASKVVTIERIL